MLCLNCQSNTSDSVGINAGQGTFQRYLGNSSSTNATCLPVTNPSLSSETQASVCNTNLRIPNELYVKLWWKDGSWNYTRSKELINSDISTYGSGNLFTQCPSTSNSSTSNSSPSFSAVIPTSSSSSATNDQPADSAPSQKLSGNSGVSPGAIAGAVLGACATAAGGILLLYWLCLRKRRQIDYKEMTRPEPFKESPRGSTRPASLPPFEAATDLKTDLKFQRDSLLYGKGRLYTDTSDWQ
ncbi:hypothetical protein GYMLUDRAFT_399285 [Collybiopsis luxurians FD-317 M1]|nr:hypothetical protein GYMLUDRAFT_399285 [Collybiopsis luxurians FD-317 M1]